MPALHRHPFLPALQFDLFAHLSRYPQEKGICLCSLAQVQNHLSGLPPLRENAIEQMPLFLILVNSKSCALTLFITGSFMYIEQHLRNGLQFFLVAHYDKVF